MPVHSDSTCATVSLETAGITTVISASCRLTGQSLLRAERNSNECNWSTARKKIGPVNRPCDRPIDVISIASLIFLVTSRLADQRQITPILQPRLDRKSVV